MPKLPVEKLLDSVDWKPTGAKRVKPDIPVATHEGVLKIGDLEFKVVQLDNGMRLIDEESVAKFFDWLKENSG